MTTIAPDLHKLLNAAWLADEREGYAARRAKDHWEAIERDLRREAVDSDGLAAARRYLDLRPGRAAQRLREALLLQRARDSFLTLWRTSGLNHRWHEAEKDGDVGVGSAHDVFERLREYYTEERRHYHTLEHVLATLDAFTVLVNASAPNEVLGAADNMRCGLLAIWFHDARMDFKASDEERSAAYAAGVPLEGGRPALIDRTEAAILATAHQSPAGSELSRYVVDADLSILAAESDYFDAYERRIRAEWASVPATEFAQKRVWVLSTFLSRPRIYQTAAGRALWEERAIANLERSIERLSRGEVLS